MSCSTSKSFASEAAQRRSSAARTVCSSISISHLRFRLSFRNHWKRGALWPVAPVLCRLTMRQLWFGLRIGLGGTRDNVRIWSVSGAKDFSPRFGQVAYSNAVASCSSITRPRHCPDHIDQAGNVLRAAAFGLGFVVDFDGAIEQRRCDIQFRGHRPDRLEIMRQQFDTALPWRESAFGHPRGEDAELARRAGATGAGKL